MPLLSVVVPAYNVEKTILETLRSIQNQTFSDFELIVINDGSTDGTLNVLDTIRDRRMKVFSYENGGLPEARNRGIDRASGEFITFIDADDLWTKDKLERQVAALQNNSDAGLAYSWTCFMDSQGEAFSHDFPYCFEGNVYPRLLVGNFLSSGSNVMLRREAIESVGKFDPTLKSIEDWEYWIRVAAKWPFAVVPKYQILYRQSATSMASKVDVMEKYSEIVIDRAFAAAPAELQYLKKHSLANTYQYLARLCVNHNPDAEKIQLGGQNLQKAIRLHPKIVFEAKVQRLVAKWMLLRVASPQLYSYVLKHFSRMKPNKDPRRSGAQIQEFTNLTANQHSFLETGLVK